MRTNKRICCCGDPRFSGARARGVRSVSVIHRRSCDAFTSATFAFAEFRHADRHDERPAAIPCVRAHTIRLTAPRQRSAVIPLPPTLCEGLE
jgi:hypothetical protein